ncbi:MAG TPA: GNAT family N-acetyltransferase [Pirellulales bacterium]|jgi:GNAT superfamily N-acetyltransferase|nr:GNAT family N-acetyltransferase [Pirellulales bacterium]
MPPNPIIIRPAASSDQPTIVEFNRLLALESEQKQLSVKTLGRGVAACFERPELARYFIAELGGAIIGQAMITYEWSDWRCGMFWWIQSVYVEPGSRRRGVFRALFEQIASRAKADGGVCGLRLYVEAHNQAALATYRGMGMQPSGHLVYELDWSSSIEPSKL